MMKLIRKIKYWIRCMLNPQNVIKLPWSRFDWYDRDVIIRESMFMFFIDHINDPWHVGGIEGVHESLNLEKEQLNTTTDDDMKEMHQDEVARLANYIIMYDWITSGRKQTLDKIDRITTDYRATFDVEWKDRKVKTIIHDQAKYDEYKTRLEQTQGVLRVVDKMVMKLIVEYHDGMWT